ncbi:MAG: cell division protein FtsZ [Candidatus Aureabacteria bacterium]|nr:cell division protein FtsZ [Candidatus Auribacterota bacterium]
MGMMLFDTKKGLFQVRIKVLGIGGGGCNAVDTMVRMQMQKVAFAAVNTDIQSLGRCAAEEKIQIGELATSGLGAGANPSIGRQAAEESLDRIQDSLQNTDICIITAGMGGGTGTGAAPVIAQAARQMGKLVIAFVTTPFEFEGRQRTRNALAGLDELRSHVHTLIVIPNEKLYAMITEDTSLLDAFKKVDFLLMEAVKSLTRMILEPGLINLDYADVRSVMSIPGPSLISFGEGMGVHRAVNAVDAALSNILAESRKLKGAKGLLVNVVGGVDLTLHEVTRCIRKLQTTIHDDANIIFGANIDASVGDKVMITLIATGIEESVDDTSRIMAPYHQAPKETESKAESLRLHPHPPGDGSALFEGPFQSSNEEDLDIPAYLRRNKKYLGIPSREIE